MSDPINSEKYEIQEEIAQGAMGIVCKALDRKLNRVVALKVVHKHLTSDESFLKRFLREARAMAQLQHPNIVTIHAVEQHQGTQFIVMEYFPGTTLQARIETTSSFPLSDAIAITRQLASALAYAHGHGIIHRDIKPANVLIGSDNLVKLTDFGIAAAVDEAPLTTAGQLIGTLRYMSPEQARDATLDGRSDLYSLGLIFYEMLTGTHPRRNQSNAAILGMLGAEEKAPPLTFPSSIPLDVQQIVKDLLRFRPTDRIEDARSLGRRLESLGSATKASVPSAASPDALSADATIFELETKIGAAPKKNVPPQRKTSQLGLVLGVGAVVLLLGLGAYALVKTKPEPIPPQSIGPSETAIPSPTPSIPLKPDPDLINRLEQIRRFVEQKNLAGLENLSAMSEKRRKNLEALFKYYSTIEVSLGPVESTATEIQTSLRVDKLITTEGESLPIEGTLRKIPITVPREGDGWGKIVW